MQYRYKVLLTLNPGTPTYTVTVPALPGCVTEGDSIPEALNYAADAIGLYIETETVRGRAVPKEPLAAATLERAIADARELVDGEPLVTSVGVEVPDVVPTTN